MLAVLVNFCSVVVGGLLGVLFKKGIPERVVKSVMAVIGLCVIYVGIDSVFDGNNTVLLISSIALGTLIGALIKVEDNFTKFTNYIENKFKKGEDSQSKTSISQGFVSAMLIFCTGAMAITGSINAGLSGDYDILFTKSVIDGITAFMLASSLGIGVALASIPVLIYQGTLTLLAGLLSGIENALICEVISVGGIMILAIGLNLTGMTKIKVADMLPAIILVVPLFYLFRLIGI